MGVKRAVLALALLDKHGELRSDQALFCRGDERRRASLPHCPVNVGHFIKTEGWRDVHSRKLLSRECEAQDRSALAAGASHQHADVLEGPVWCNLGGATPNGEQAQPDAPVRVEVRSGP